MSKLRRWRAQHETCGTTKKQPLSHETENPLDFKDERTHGTESGEKEHVTGSCDLPVACEADGKSSPRRPYCLVLVKRDNSTVTLIMICICDICLLRSGAALGDRLPVQSVGGVRVDLGAEESLHVIIGVYLTTTLS